jgi:hypothetical protein
MDADGCDGDYEGLPLDEKQDIPVSNDYLFWPVAFRIEHKMTFTEYKAIRAKPRKAIGISQTGVNHKAFFIKDLQYKIKTGEVSIVAWPKEYFEIQIVNGTTEGFTPPPVPPALSRYFGIEFGGHFG